MIAPLPWQIARPQPPLPGDRVYIVDAGGRAVIPAALDDALAEFIIAAANQYGAEGKS